METENRVEVASHLAGWVVGTGVINRVWGVPVRS